MVRRPWRGGYDEGKKKKGATARKMWARHTGQSIGFLLDGSSACGFFGEIIEDYVEELR